MPKQSPWSLTVFLRYCTLKNPIIKSILTNTVRTRLSTDKGFAVKYKCQCFILDYFQKKLKNFFFKKSTIFGPLYPFLGKHNVSLNPVPISFSKTILTKYHCAKCWRKSNEWFLSNTGFRGTHVYMHGTGVS